MVEKPRILVADNSLIHAYYSKAYHPVLRNPDTSSSHPFLDVTYALEPPGVSHVGTRPIIADGDYHRAMIKRHLTPHATVDEAPEGLEQAIKMLQQHQYIAVFMGHQILYDGCPVLSATNLGGLYEEAEKVLPEREKAAASLADHTIKNTQARAILMPVCNRSAGQVSEEFQFTIAYPPLFDKYSPEELIILPKPFDERVLRGFASVLLGHNRE